MIKYHPIHPALVHFPIAFWFLAVSIDFASPWLDQDSRQWSAALLSAGCTTGFLAMLSGLNDLRHVPDGQPLRDTYWHIGLMLSAFMLFTLRLALRLDNWQPLPANTLSLLLDIAGMICLTIGGWHGGTLVYRHRIGGFRRH